MRTSNKILLIFFLSAITVFSAVHLTLYAKFTRGEIITGKDPERKIFDIYTGPTPSVLFIKGKLNVTIVPSDSFAIKWEKDIGGKLNLRAAGDSLIIEGSLPGRIDPSDERMPLESLALTVHYGHLKHIGLSGCLARIDGTERAATFAIDLRLQDAQLRFGGYAEYNGDIRAGPIREYFDSIRVEATHSNLMIGQNASIGNLTVQLADRSVIRDGNASIGKPEIHYSDDSRLDLSGVNLRKLK